MNNLTLINTNGKFTVDSREVAEMVGKRHDHLVRDIQGYENIINSSFENPNLDSLDFFIPDKYSVEGNNKSYRCYLLTRKGCDMVANKMTGEKGVLFTATYVTKFEEMEKKQIAVAPGYIDSKFLFAIATQLEEKEKQNLQLSAKIEQDKPKVLFADTVSTAHTTILIGELAKLLKQNGIDIGEKRLFEWLRNKGYIINRKGTDYNAPTQRAMNLELFTVKETVINHSDGHVTVNKTTKVTGKGQQYFINKFLEQKGA